MKEKKPVTYKSGKRSEPAVLRDAAVAEWGRVVTVRDAKAHLSALLEWVAEGHELTITSNGQPRARLVSVGSAKPRKVFNGMGEYLSRQPIHRGSADEAVNWTRGEW
ncbi:MAG TPA: type II toxin-antitoxin system prevent-host-death family antitoxin [Verrucomicrobiota bacterium]|nr:type II toxin-antitoxin system prevent-host-death family antitoxin [Verrucomicrobiota bacterium]